MKHCLFLVLVTVFLFLQTKGKERIPVFLGVNPSVTVEPFYQKGEMDINILPVVFQKPLTGRMDLRLTTVLNWGIRKGGGEVSHLGAEAALPVFLRKKENKTAYSKGFFLSPVMSFTQNRMESHNNIGLWIELGYHLLFDRGFAMSFGLQAGGTYFMYDNTQTKWGSHFGVKIVLGRWLKNNSQTKA